MTALIKLAAALFLMAVVPAFMGLLPCALLPAKERTLPRIVMSGYFCLFTLFELTALPVLLLTHRGNFRILVVLFSILSAAAILAGLVLTIKTGGIALPKWSRPAPLTLILWAIFGGLLLFQLYMAYTRAFFDGDDAYYVASAVITDATSTMYRILPYTGGSTSLDVRHALALFPMWSAYVARLSGTHVSIITHSLTPLIILPLSDLAAGMTAARILERNEKLKENKALLPAILVVVVIIQIFGNVSIYTPETFLMMRSWQGKSLYVNLLLPAVFLAFLEICKLAEQNENATRGETLYGWLFIVMINISAGLCTSMAGIFVPCLIGLAGLLLSITLKNGKLFLRTVLACIPNMLYCVLLLYLLLSWNIFMG